MKNRTEAKTIDIALRKTTFEEVQCAFTEEEALDEANRCLNCPTRPCVASCPVNIQIPDFIQAIKEKNYEESYRIITASNLFPSICGRVCPQERQCEGSCVLARAKQPIAVGNLERFASQYETDLEIKEKTTAKVAVIGSGPAGLACATDLLKSGVNVTVYEALHDYGGVLRYGIPDFRLPNKVVEQQITKLQSLGCKFRNNFLVGKTSRLVDLRKEGYHAFFVASGAGFPSFLGVPNEGSIGVFSANEFLTRVNLMNAHKEEFDTPLYSGKHVVVIGGGNVAMDAARCALRLGSRVSILYRREIEDMPARNEEIKHAIEEGIEIIERVNPTAFLADERRKITGVVLIKMQLQENENDTRRNFIPLEGSEYEIEADVAIVAIGTKPNSNFAKAEKEIVLNNRGCIIVNEDMQTAIPDVFSGGDAINGGATVIAAMGDGKKAASNILSYLEKEKILGN